MGPVADQDTDWCSGDCWAHSGAGLTEGQLHISAGSNIGVFLNATDIVQHALFGCGGSYPSVALNYIKNYKAVSYMNGNPGTFPNLIGAMWGILSYNTVSGVSAIKSALVNGPVTACFYVYGDFYRFFSDPANKTSVYHYNWDGNPGALLGGHAVVIVSYDDTQQCWICKNSWADWWADGGYFRIGYGQCGMDSWENCTAAIDQSCWAKIVPNLFSTINVAFNYPFMNYDSILNGLMS